MSTQQILAPKYGTLTKAENGSYTLHYERKLAHPIAQVWRALTDPQQVSRWFAQMELPAEGEPFTITFVGGSQGHFRLLRKQEPALLEYTWGSGLEGEPSIVRFELAEAGPSATQLTLTHRGLAKSVEGHGEGWHQHLDYLADVLAETLDCLPGFHQWPRLHADYYRQRVQEA